MIWYGDTAESRAMARRDRIGDDDMGTHLAVALAVKRNLADREPGAELEELRFGAYPERRWLPQGIDGEAGGDRELDAPHRRQHRGVDDEIGQHHQERTADRADRPPEIP